MKKNCIICDTVFDAKSIIHKICSNNCRNEFYHRKEKKRYSINKISFRKTANCITCKNKFDYHFRKERKERVFCSRSCASKFYIKKGTFDAWKTRKNKKSGKDIKCLNPSCQIMIYVPPRMAKVNKGKVCSSFCEKAYFSQLFAGERNPFFGQKFSKESKEKQLKTLQSHYPNIKNAFSLAKRRTKTKPQIEIFNYVSSYFAHFDFEIEKRIAVHHGKEFFGDIVSFREKILIEFNGDYWHCNPKKYDKDYFHEVKQMYAHQLWCADEKRLETILSYGYKIYVIWESDFKKCDWQKSLNQWLEKHEKEKNINAFRSSVNNYSSADLKLGELLESHRKNTTT